MKSIFSPTFSLEALGSASIVLALTSNFERTGFGLEG